MLFYALLHPPLISWPNASAKFDGRAVCSAFGSGRFTLFHRCNHFVVIRQRWGMSCEFIFADQNDFELAKFGKCLIVKSFSFTIYYPIRMQALSNLIEHTPRHYPF